MSAEPILVIGLGCQRGCPASTLQALLDETLLAHGIELHRVRALASIDLKRDEPGLLELAGQLALPLTCFSVEQLAGYEQRLSHRSEIAFQRTGCYGIAESAALALADQLGTTPATLLITRQKGPKSTLALAVVA
ncbi:cobalt-precorrin 5A hydrolase [Pseudomonas sp. NFACC23-1]|uniref:cobalamin biosynthesis protein n=1 Tax=unclassified Pseudomonas TaxID=196821 RepID=UPI000883AECA|nr:MULTISPECIES: cobalamin biosynthesis protein [unclassified Pseudomonas]SDB51217.1 cobalt-precorrin 5A hydrolase [Pseudomonas sp. NFACC17-2]SEI93851.1 cobalt-precorrin 5A hydrolase [Pseudomonas sp. NFACC23-1]SFW85386.1 cobalt-precorrin 5A hydrolase [Pseudomonas sp. NFACC16-2]